MYWDPIISSEYLSQEYKAHQKKISERKENEIIQAYQVKQEYDLFKSDIYGLGISLYHILTG